MSFPDYNDNISTQRSNTKCPTISSRSPALNQTSESPNFPLLPFFLETLIDISENIRDRWGLRRFGKVSFCWYFSIQTGMIPSFRGEINRCPEIILFLDLYDHITIKSNIKCIFFWENWQPVNTDNAPPATYWSHATSDCNRSVRFMFLLKTSRGRSIFDHLVKYSPDFMYFV